MTDLRRRTVTAVVYGAVVVVATVLPPSVFAVLMLIAFAVATAELVGLRRAGLVSLVEGIVLAVGLLSLFVLRDAGASLNAHRWPQAAPAWLLLALVPTWAADVAAYAVGSLAGRHKLAPRISPAKTWEGTIGGLAAAALAAFGTGALFGLPRASVALVVLALGPLALAGDLLESYLKRRAGVKDSGTLLPGHGGLLDRIDSLIAVAPLVTYALLLQASLG